MASARLKRACIEWKTAEAYASFFRDTLHDYNKMPDQERKAWWMHDVERLKGRLAVWEPRSREAEKIAREIEKEEEEQHDKESQEVEAGQEQR